MRIIHVMNPAAGKGNIEKYLEIPEIKNNSYITKGIYDAENFAEKECKACPETRFVVYGGDGTANEVVNGIMKSGHSDTAQIKVVPTGTGNDFIKSLINCEEQKSERIDIIKYNDRYALNILNFGFDCNVVVKTQKYKKLPLVSGSFAYILGVADTLLRPIGEKFGFEYTDASGITHKFDEDCTLCAAANGKFYGGGFMAAPIAELTDGLIDLMIIKKASKPKFLSLVGDYKAGKHIDPETLQPTERFKELITFVRCKSVSVSGLSSICADGEIEEVSNVDISVIPDAVNVVYQ